MARCWAGATWIGSRSGQPVHRLLRQFRAIQAGEVGNPAVSDGVDVQQRVLLGPGNSRATRTGPRLAWSTRTRADRAPRDALPAHRPSMPPKPFLSSTTRSNCKPRQSARSNCRCGIPRGSCRSASPATSRLPPRANVTPQDIQFVRRQARGGRQDQQFPSREVSPAEIQAVDEIQRQAAPEIRPGDLFANLHVRLTMVVLVAKPRVLAVDQRDRRKCPGASK